MICTSVGEKNYKDAISVAAYYDFAEIRLDMLEKIDAEIVKQIFSSHKNLIATNRKCGQSSSRLAMLDIAAHNGASYIDTDINEEKEFISFTKKLCKKDVENSQDKTYSSIENRTKLIISYHNFDTTPELKFFDKIVADAAAYCADVIKIACRTEYNYAVERLLSLPSCYSSLKIVIAGMGKLGARVRVLSQTAGSYFTYASHTKESATAEGQLDYKTLLKEQERLSNVW